MRRGAYATLAIDGIFYRWNWLTVIISNQIFSERTNAYDLSIGSCSRRKEANDSSNIHFLFV